MKQYIPIFIGKYLQVLSLFSSKKATKKAFNIFCTPLKGKAKPRHQDFFDTSLQERHQINEHQIATYHWKGEGKTILLLHGWESNSFRWKNLVEKLKEKNYNIIAVDAPSQGNSTGKYLNVPVYTECVKHIINIYKPSILVGHSLGGMTSIYYQYKNQNPTINKIIALGPPSELSIFIKAFKETLRLSDNFIKKLESYIYQTFNFYPKDFSIAKFASTLNVDGLLILEKYDHLAPYKYSKPIAENWENCSLIVVENIGHSLQGEKVDNLVLQHIKAS